MNNIEENKALVRRGFEEGWNQGNMDVEAEIMATDVVCHMVGRPDIHGNKDWEQFVTMFRTAFPDINFTVEDHFGEGGKVATRWAFTGTHKGELLGIPPTGAHVTVTGINIYHIVGGKIIEFWIKLDDLGMLQQLGVIPLMGQGEK